MCNGDGEGDPIELLRRTKRPHDLTKAGWVGVVVAAAVGGRIGRQHGGPVGAVLGAVIGAALGFAVPGAVLAFRRRFPKHIPGGTQVRGYLCARHRAARRRTNAGAVLILVAGLVIAIGMKANHGRRFEVPVEAVLTIVVAIAASIILLKVVGTRQRRILRPVLYKSGCVYLSGAGAPFLASLPESETSAAPAQESNPGG